MQDHGLFQAICRTNRLDTDDKEFGHIVDYKDLFQKVENAIAVYSSELDHSSGGDDPEILLQDRLGRCRDKLNDALKAMAAICEPVPHPQDELDFIRYFCGNTEKPEELSDREPRRVALYKGVVALMRAYANIKAEIHRAGFSPENQERIKRDVDRYTKLRETIRLASGEFLDLKPFEADMRHLLDTYIDAKEPRKISEIGNIGLLEAIVKTGRADEIAQDLTTKGMGRRSRPDHPYTDG